MSALVVSNQNTQEPVEHLSEAAASMEPPEIAHSMIRSVPVAGPAIDRVIFTVVIVVVAAAMLEGDRLHQPPRQGVIDGLKVEVVGREHQFLPRVVAGALEEASTVVVGIDRFGLSAPGGTVMAELGISVENVVKQAALAGLRV